MPKEVFDQDRPRSSMARRLDEAFVGCEEWTIAPPSRQRGDLVPWPSSPGPANDPSVAIPPQRSRAA